MRRNIDFVPSHSGRMSTSSRNLGILLESVQCRPMEAIPWNFSRFNSAGLPAVSSQRNADFLLWTLQISRESSEPPLIVSVRASGSCPVRVCELTEITVSQYQYLSRAAYIGSLCVSVSISRACIYFPTRTLFVNTLLPRTNLKPHIIKGNANPHCEIFLRITLCNYYSRCFYFHELGFERQIIYVEENFKIYV